MNTQVCRRRRSATPIGFKGNCYSKIGVEVQPGVYGRKMMFSCGTCGTPRQYGSLPTVPYRLDDLESQSPVIFCGTCKQATRHVFKGVE